MEWLIYVVGPERVKYVPNFFPQIFSLTNFFQIPGSGSKLGNTLDKYKKIIFKIIPCVFSLRKIQAKIQVKITLYRLCLAGTGCVKTQKKLLEWTFLGSGI